MKSLTELIERLQAIVNSRTLLNQVIKDELLEIKKKYKTPRRSVFVFSADEAEAERADVRAPGVASLMCITADGKFKCVSEKNFNMSNKEIGEKSKPSSVVVQSVHMKSDEQAFIFSDRGNCYRLYAESCNRKFGENGYSLSDLFEDADKKEKPVAILPAGGEDGNLLFITRQGMLKKTVRAEYSLPKPSFPAIRLNEGDELIAVQRDAEEEGVTVFFVTKGGMCLNERKDDIPLQGRIAGGVK